MLRLQMAAGIQIFDLIVTLKRRDKIAHHRLRALVKQLIKRMLGIRAQLAPQHRAGGVVHRLALARHRFAIGLHLQLLKIGGKVLKPPVVGQNRVSANIQKVNVPDTCQAQ